VISRPDGIDQGRWYHIAPETLSLSWRKAVVKISFSFGYLLSCLVFPLRSPRSPQTSDCGCEDFFIGCNGALHR
jgi:hypothetical protein